MPRTHEPPTFVIQPDDVLAAALDQGWQIVYEHDEHTRLSYGDLWITIPKRLASAVFLQSSISRLAQLAEMPMYQYCAWLGFQKGRKSTADD